ncbi:MAG: chemotaxis protein CheX [Candidatus Zixiibacteriota bacterium]
MQVEIISQFTLSVSEVFENMLACSVQLSQDKSQETESGGPEVIGVIGLSGTAQAVIAVRFSPEAARNAVGRMVGCTFESVDDSVTDGVGELINMIVGNAKVKLESHSLTMGLPSVFLGSLCKVNTPPRVNWVDLPFTCELGSFNLAIAFRAIAPNEKEANRVNSYSR